MIDVIIPAYNCRKTLRRTLSSLVAQTDTDFKVTVIDDNSTEDIHSIYEDFVDNLNICYIMNERNLGCGMSRQVGIDNTECSHFTFLDSDDMFMPYTVETFNSIISANPSIEYVHSYFYEQTQINGDPALILHKDGFTWCHGKLYNRELVNKYRIRNSPLIKWADDSFFNSMCTELMKVDVIGVPTMLWCNNQDSVMRKTNYERDAMVKEDFLLAMKMSAQFVLQYKDSIEHMDRSMSRLLKKYSLNENEQKLMNEILELKVSVND